MRKQINWLVNSIKKTLRILCVFIFLYWFFSSYANCTNYYESIKKAKSHEEEVEYGKKNPKTIKEIEDDVLGQIEEKKGLTVKLPRKWKEKDFTSKNFAEAKDLTIKNIQNQLKENDLDIAELDDRRTTWEKIKRDPLKFFFVSPLNKTTKLLNNSLKLQKNFFLEIVFKSLVVKLFFLLFVNYPEDELRKFSKVWEKAQDPALSVEEKEKIQQEMAPFFSRWIFNLFLTSLLASFIIFHPAFVSKDNSQYLAFAYWLKWIPLVIVVSFLSSIGNEFFRQGKILSIKEIKEYLVKSWISILIFNLIFYVGVPLISPEIINTRGGYLIILFNGLIDFLINLIRARILQKSKTKPKIKKSKSWNKFKR